jgi:ribosomal-protein-alanine N-acetyltransferase
LRKAATGKHKLETRNFFVTFSIRPAVAADLPSMMAVEKHAATAAHWSQEQYEALFHASSPQRVALIIHQESTHKESEIHGFAIARLIGEEWEIENIAIAAPARRQGLGTRLLGELLDLAREKGAAAVFLEVRESNHAARALYEKWAFLESGRRPRYYSNPDEDAILYRLEFA